MPIVGSRAAAIHVRRSRRRCPACTRRREMRLLALVGTDPQGTYVGLALECPCGAVWGPVEMRAL
jgi:hypothetical protein